MSFTLVLCLEARVPTVAQKIYAANCGVTIFQHCSDTRILVERAQKNPTIEHVLLLPADVIEGKLKPWPKMPNSIMSLIDAHFAYHERIDDSRTPALKCIKNSRGVTGFFTRNYSLSRGPSK